MFSFLGQWFLFDDDFGGVSVLPFNPDKIGYTPLLKEGDLLLMRGDIFHRTQDADTERVALARNK